MLMLETYNINNDTDENSKTDVNNMKDLCPEYTSLTKINSSASSITSVKLDSNELHESSSINQMDLKNERHNGIKISKEKKAVSSEITKERKSKSGASFPRKFTYHNKYPTHPLLKRKLAPVALHTTNVTAKVVSFERNVEIKDLESKVKYLQNKIKELENENKTLQGVQSRQERELKKFKEGVANIPSLLRSHKEETKVYESTLSNIRRELRDCQKDIKIKNEVSLKKESHIDKLNVTMKRYKKNIQDLASELREFKATEKDLEEENKILLGTNEQLKSENENLQKKIKSMVQQMQNLEENFMKEKNLNKQYKDDLCILQKKYEDMQLKVSSIDTHKSDELVLGIPQKGNTCKILTENIPQDKLDDSKSPNLLLEETKEKKGEEVLCTDKAKDVLIHTLKCYQDLCNSKHSNCATKACGIGANNLKLLPPLKQPHRKSSRSMQSGVYNKESFSSSVDVNAKNVSRQWQSEELAKYFQSKFKTSETPKFESNGLLRKEIIKTDQNTSLSEIIKANNSQSFIQISTLDNW